MLLWGLGTGTAKAAPCDEPIQNEVVCENSKPGDPSSQWDVSGSGDANIQGFATDISVDRGETVQFKVDTPSSDYRLDIYRMGYYEGDGAREVATVTPSASLPQNQPDCLEDEPTGLVDCGNWGQSASWAVPSTAVSGIYFAKLVREDQASGGSHIYFVVRDDDSGSDVLFQTADTTWQAYNQYGGTSLYTGGSGPGRGYKVSYNRPFTTRGPTPEDSPFNAEYPMVRWLERNGYDVSYFTGVDGDRNGDEILEHEIFLSVGHDEYWSAGQRTNVEAARDAGVNLAFFSGNEAFWKTRWENSIDGSGTSHRTLVCYKETHAGAKIDPSPVWTGTWRDRRAFNPEGPQPENSMTGTIFTVNSGTSEIEVPAAEGKMRLWRNTGLASLAPGDSEMLGDSTLGYEWDEDLDNGFRPDGLIRLSSGFRTGIDKLQDNGSTYATGNATHNLTLYRAPSDALVFGAGTVQWSWGLDGEHDRGSAPPDQRMQQANVNLFADMGVQPDTLQAALTPASASSDTTAPSSQITSPAAGAEFEAGQAMTITGTSTDGGGGVVGGIEVSVDGDTWHPAEGRGNWTYTATPQTPGPMTIRTRAADDSANLETPGPGRTVNVTEGECPCSIWNDSVTPPIEDDPNPVEVGVKFRTDVDGEITGLRYYKGAANTGTHIGHLWSATGTQLAEATFTGESSSGWQEVVLDPPVAVDAGTTYIASYHAPNGNYAATNGYFTEGTDSPPLHALADGVDGANGVYNYGPAGVFPNSTFGSSNYWVDVVFQDDTGPDTTPPVISAVTPANGSSGVNAGSNVSATFNEPMNPATINGSTIELRGPGNALVPSTVSYSAATRTATLDPTANLENSTAYTATVMGGAGGVKDVAGNDLSSVQNWNFSTAAAPPPPPDEGPGGPILVVAGAGNPFGRYFAEILRNEGLNEFNVTDISGVTPSMLNEYDVVILGETPLSPAQAQTYSEWVTAGGNLIAMRPDGDLAGLLGITAAGSPLQEGYIDVDTDSPPGEGIAPQTLQFHGAADRYTAAGATTVATLFSDADTATSNPAVTMRSVGSNGGQAAAFTYDLARSIVYTRQGNPAWEGQSRDGQDGPIRADNLFFGDASGDPQPDWVDPDRIAIPQADEQQRLLANLIGEMNEDRKPLPRFWYFPRAEKAVVVMTGDDHASGGTAGRFDHYKAISPAGCSVADWECVRSTSYVYPDSPLTNAQAVGYEADGFEVALHQNTNCSNFTPASLDQMYDDQLADFGAKYTGVPAPSTNRSHCIPWSDWASQPKVELDHGIRFDTNYYYWPPEFVNDQPGVFTGSAMPMRFADLDGSMIDVFQATTQMTDESAQSYPATVNTLLDRAVGTEGYYGAYVANMHTDSVSSAGSEAIVAAAQTRGVPVVSSRQMLRWLDGRNGSSFQDLAWNGDQLEFSIEVGEGANGLRAMLPATSDARELTGVERDGNPVTITSETIKGVEYAFFAATPGDYEAVYGDEEPPTGLIDTTVADFSAGDPGPNGYVSATDDGELMLKPAVGEEFSGGTLPAGWTATSWESEGGGAGGSASVSGGRLHVNGAFAETDAAVGPGHSLEFSANFGAAPFQHVGFSDGFENVWAIFSTNATNNQLFARTNTGSALIDTPVPGSLIGSEHRYRIEWEATEVRFYVDGGLVATHAATFAPQMSPAASEFNAGGPENSVSWMRMSPYPASATFDSRIFDGGQQVLWQNLDWVSEVPAGTGVALSVRTGNTPSPDGSWSAFAPIASPGGAIGASSRYLQYRAVLSSSDAFRSPSLTEVSASLGTPGDTTPPTIAGRSPAPDATGVPNGSNIEVEFSEPMDPATITSSSVTLRKQGAGTDVPATVSYSGVTATLDPSADLDPTAVYEVTVAGTVEDAAGNPLGVDDGWSFTTSEATVGFIDTTTSDFAAGNPGANTHIAEDGDGEVILKPAVAEEFSGGPGLPAGWSSSNGPPWGGGTATVTGGALRVDGAVASTDATFGPGRVLEFRGTLGAGAFNHAGFSSDGFQSDIYAMFSTGNSSNELRARTNFGNGETSFTIPGASPADSHLFRIEWVAGEVRYFVDGNPVATHSGTFSVELRPTASDLNLGGPAVSLEWLRLDPYAASGTFESRVFDSGLGADWGAIAWDAEVPAGTGLVLSVRTGNTATPDAGWSDFTPVATSGGDIPGSSRYVQYRAVLSTSDTTRTPILRQVEIQGSEQVSPTAVDDQKTVLEDAAAEAIDVLANDTDPDGGAKTIESVGTAGTVGTVAITGGGTGLTYQPAAGYCNTDPGGQPDTFTYQLNGGSEATVSVTVTCADDPPIAVNDQKTVVEDAGAEAIDVLANDTDPDGGPKAIESIDSTGTNGTVAITGGGTGLTYQPDSGYCNTDPGGVPDTFTYQLNGGSEATVSVTVTCADDPQDEPPVAVDDQKTVLEDAVAEAIDVLANDTDPDGGPKTIVSTDTTGTNGTVAITGGGTGLTYQPDADYCNTNPGGQPDTFTYQLNGGSEATVSVTVTCADDSPTAVNDQKTVLEDAGAEAIDVLANDTDPDGGPKTIESIDTTGTNGTVAITGGGTGITYQPDVGYCNTDPGGQPDSFTYQLNGGSEATVSVTVTCADDPQDEPPVAVNDQKTVLEDSGAAAIDVLANDTDVDGGPKTIVSTDTTGTNGTVTITGGGTGLTYQPDANYCNSNPGGQPDTFTYQLNGGSEATVSVTVTCTDDSPTAVNDQKTVVEDSGAAAIDVLANDTDADGGPKTIVSVGTAGTAGTVAITGGGAGVTYQPAAGYCNTNPGGQPDTFTYQLNGGSQATVSVIVTCADDPPTAVDDQKTVVEDAGAGAIDVLANDTDPDGGPKTIVSIDSTGTNGTVAITGGGTGLTYKPDANYCNTNPGGQPDTFTYQLNGGSEATVSVTVTCVVDPPPVDRRVEGAKLIAKNPQIQNGRQIKIRLKATAREAVRLIASGDVFQKIKSRGPDKLEKVGGLTVVRTKIDAGNTAILILVPRSERANAKILELLDDRVQLTADVSVEFTDRAGNSVTRDRTLKLKSDKAGARKRK